MDKSTYDFSVGSLNTRGLNDNIKRQAIFNWIKKKNVDIFMLQECYCMEETSLKWEQQWGGKCLFSYGTKHSKGTIILFKQGLDVNVTETKIDIEGRYIIIRANIQGETFIIVNLYAPTKLTEKDNFFKKLMTEIENINVAITDRLILGGDWNTIQDIKIDKKGGNKNISATLPKYLAELMSNYNLVDIWRILNPTIDRYTYRQKSPLIQTHLDYFLISNNVQDLIVKTDILPSIRSDHSAITIQVKTSSRSNKRKWTLEI